MDVFIPVLLMEVLYREDHWHMNYDPKLCGQYTTHDKAREELSKCFDILIKELEKDSRFRLVKQVEPESERCCIQVDVYYTDRCITIKGYVFTGPIK